MVWFEKLEPKTKAKATYTISQVRYITLAFCKSYKLQVQYIALVIYCTCGISQMSFVKLKKEIKQRRASFIFLFYILRSGERKEILERNFSSQAIWRAHFEGGD